MIPVYFYVRWRYGKVSIYTEMAEYQPTPRTAAKVSQTQREKEAAFSR